MSRRIHPSRLQFRLPSILRLRCRQMATIRMPPKINTRSPTLNSPSRAWSARNGSRVFDVAARHIGLAGCSVEDIPTTGILPTLASVTRAFSISPESISRTPIRTQGDRTVRTTSHRIAQDSQSQTAGCCVHANWLKACRSAVWPSAEISRILNVPMYPCAVTTWPFWGVNRSLLMQVQCTANVLAVDFKQHRYCMPDLPLQDAFMMLDKWQKEQRVFVLGGITCVRSCRQL